MGCNGFAITACWPIATARSNSPAHRQLLAQPAPAVKRPDAPLDYRDRYERLTGKSLRDCPREYFPKVK